MNRNQLHIIYGDKDREMAIELLQRMDVGEGLTRDSTIGIKPNLVNPNSSEEGATTSPKIIAGILEYLTEKGFSDILIMEGSWVGSDTEKVFSACGYRKLAAKYGAKLIDLKRDRTEKITVRELEIEICRQVREVDYLINVPVLKAHCQTKLTCALKNMKGCIPDREKRRFHSLGLHKPIAYLGKIFSPDLIIVDAVIGDLTFEEGGNPVRMNRIIAGLDPVLIDSYAASLIGYNTDDIEYIEIAESLGIGPADRERAEIIEYNTGAKSGIGFNYSSRIGELTDKVKEKEACSACMGSLIHALQRLKDENKLNRVDTIHIGQGYRNRSETGLGIGRCTGNFDRNTGGCPPSAQKIREFIKDNI